MIRRLFMIGLRYPAPVLFIVTALTLFSLAGLGRLVVDTSFDSLIPADDPERVVYQDVMDEFGSDNRTIVYLRDAELWTPAKLAALDRLQRGLQGIRDVTRVESLYTLRTIEGRQGRVESHPLLPGVPATVEEAENARERVLDNPLYLGNFISRDGTVTALILSKTDVDDRPDFNESTYAAIEALLEAHRGDFDALYQVGGPRIHHELTQSLFADFRLLGPLSALVLVLAILMFLRSGLAAVLPLVTSALAITWTFGMLGWTGVPLNILSAMLPALIVVIGSTEDTHIMSAYFRGLKEGVADPRRVATSYVARHIALPLVLTVLTTTLGFASNLFNDIALIQDFAIAASFAMVVNGVITILVAPMLLANFGPKGRPRGLDDDASAWLPDRIVRLFRVSQDKAPLNTLAITGALCAFFIYQAAQLHVTNDPLSYFPSQRPLIQQTEEIHRDLAGIRTFYVTLDAGVERAFLEPRNIAKLVEIQRFMARQGAFDRSVSLADHLALVHREFHGEFGELGLPETRQLVAQYLLFLHRNDIESFVSHDFSKANIVVRHNIGDSRLLSRHVSELEDLAHHVGGPEVRVTVTGENLMINRAAEGLMVGQVKALAVLLVLIFLIMSAMFTSFKGGAIALIPAVIPIAMIFGIMGLLGIPLNPGTAMVAVISVGIAIDGTIHMLARYNELCRHTSDYVRAVHRSVKEEATPLIVSSLSLALGFGILMFSEFTVIAQFGALAAATMVFSVIANLLITPIIMARIRLVGLYQIVTLRLDREVLGRTVLFDGMSGYQRRKAVLISELNEFEAGELLVEQDTVGRSMYLILSGEAEVARRDAAGEHRLATLTPGQVFGEIGFVREARRTADVRALTRITALRFDYERMQNDLKFFPNVVAKLNFNICRILGERLADMVEQARS